jgi:hypothetical protein
MLVIVIAQQSCQKGGVVQALFIVGPIIEILKN